LLLPGDSGARTSSRELLGELLSTEDWIWILLLGMAGVPYIVIGCYLDFVQTFLLDIETWFFLHLLFRSLFPGHSGA
jgi:hypothetical protein